MKTSILNWLVNLVGTLGILVIGFGAYSIYLNIQFQKAYQEQVIKAQQENIRSYCEQVWEVEHPEVEDGEEESK